MRNLTLIEISTLEKNGCIASNWNSIVVSNDFDAARYFNVRFSGYNTLGGFAKSVNIGNGIDVKGGVYNAHLHNCTIGFNVYISNVNGVISNYNIGNDVVISNVGSIAMSGESAFGNGERVVVLNEGGGREVVIYDKLSSHLAYMLAMYRHDNSFVSSVESMIFAYTDECKTSVGYIGNDVVVENCNSITNVKIGDYSKLSGVALLKNGTIKSNKLSSSYVGSGVIARDFILCEGSQIKDGAVVERCFVGQGCEIGKQYSAENSLFFANCVVVHGEACSVFAGPYTVTHHKSTLLIAGMFSFMNAGSGSNQSNHLYKLGAVHQGVLERGCKLASDSYILFPARIGAFTLVSGRHYNHCDTSDMPFSYLIESDGDSFLAPAVSLFSVGTARDVAKWEKRDKRSCDKIDKIVFDWLNPYTIGKILNGVKILEAIKFEQEGESYYTYQDCKISCSALEKGLKIYKIAISKYLGDVLSKEIEEKGVDAIVDKQFDSEIGENWIDLSGLIAPKSIVDMFVSDVSKGVLSTIEEVDKFYCDLYLNYSNYQWQWLCDTFFDNCLSENSVKALLEDWVSANTQYVENLVKDSEKEFGDFARVGYGVDGLACKNQDFENVRGLFSENEFILSQQQYLENCKGIFKLILK